MSRRDSGVTLLEVLMAMMILGMVTGGIFTAFVFARQVSYRSTSQLVALGMMRGTAEQLRSGAVGLSPGVYADDFMQNPPTGSTRLSSLNFTPEFRARYQTDPGTAPTFAGHGDGRLMIVEGNTDLDGDGKKGVNVTGGTNVDLYRVRVKVKWTPPSP